MSLWQHLTLTSMLPEPVFMVYSCVRPFSKPNRTQLSSYGMLASQKKSRNSYHELVMHNAMEELANWKLARLGRGAHRLLRVHLQPIGRMTAPPQSHRPCSCIEKQGMSLCCRTMQMCAMLQTQSDPATKHIMCYQPAADCLPWQTSSTQVELHSRLAS